MLTNVYSKNRMEAWGFCATEKKQERHEKCGSHMMINVLYMIWNKNFLDYLWEDWIEMVIASLNWATKARVWKGCFCNWLRQNWPTLTSSFKILNSPYLLPLLEFQKKFPLLTSHLKSWFPPILQRGGGLC